MLPMNGSAGVLVGAVVGTLVGKDVGLGVEVGAVVGVLVGRGVAVFVGVKVGAGVSVGFGVSVAVGVDVGVSVGLSVGEGVSVLVAVAVAVKVGLDVRVAAAIGSASRFGPSCVSRTAAATQTMITAARMTSRVFMNSSRCVLARLIDFCAVGIIADFRKSGKNNALLFGNAPLGGAAAVACVAEPAGPPVRKEGRCPSGQASARSLRRHRLAAPSKKGTRTSHGIASKSCTTSTDAHTLRA